MKKQQGMTLIGMLLVACFVGFMGYILMRVVPVYLENYSIVQAMKSLTHLPKAQLRGSAGEVAHRLRRKLSDQLYIDGINSIKPQDIKFKRLSNGIEVSIQYTATQSLFSNVSLLFNFDETAQVVISER